MRAPAGTLRLSAPNSALDLDQPTVPRPRSWRVIHAAEYVRHVLPVVEGQLAAGMRPYIVTPYGAASGESYLQTQPADRPQPTSLLQAWNQVRNWRRSIVECEPEKAADVVHAHSFASGMAAVRTCTAVVYDLCHFVEDAATAAGDTGAWLARSFRVAEQFVLSRAAAVVAHSTLMRAAAIQRGADEENAFLIPEPLDLAAMQFPTTADAEWSLSIAGSRHAVLFLAAPACSPAAASAEWERLLAAFRMVAEEIEGARLLVRVPPPELAQTHARVQAEGLAHIVVPVSAAEVPLERALGSADVVIASAPATPDANSSALLAMANARAVLAADVPQNRDVSPHGQGCLWFAADSVKDLAYRASFLARNPDFRRALGQAGFRHVQAGRGPGAIGQQYDAVYKHAISRRRSGPAAPAPGALHPIEAM